MQISYRHCSAPAIIKYHDTEKAYRQSGYLFPSVQSQADFDAFELELFRRDLERGIVLEFRILG